MTHILRALMPFLAALLLAAGAMPARAQTELLANGGFETAGAAWTVTIDGSNTADSWWSVANATEAHSGSRYQCLGAKADCTTAAHNVDGTLFQTVTVPGDAGQVVLSYYVRITTSELSNFVRDRLDVEVRSTGGALLQTVDSLSNLDASRFGAWTLRRVSIDGYAGQTIRVAFHGRTDRRTQTTFRIDDASLLAGGASVTAPAVQTLAADAVFASGARLNASVIPNGSATSVRFEYGPTVAYGSITPSVSLPAGASPVAVQTFIGGLQPGSSYHFRAVASNAAGTTVGADASFSTTAAETSRVQGTDTSRWQGGIDWPMALADGRRFAMLQATDGYRSSPSQPMFTDPSFATQAAAARQAGVVVGAYHFARPYLNAARDEAAFFLSVAGAYIGQGFLPPALDIEDPDDELPAQPVSAMSNAALSQWIRDWCDAVEAATGVRPMLYMTPWFTQNKIEADIARYPLWIAYWYDNDPNADPGPLGPWGSDWTFLQYSITGSKSWVQYSPVDLDVFRGEVSALGCNALAAGDCDGDGIPNAVEAPERRNALVKDNDVFTNSRLFAMQQYRDFFSREGDPGGIAWWVGQLDSGLSRPAALKGLLASPEFQQSVPPIVRLYFAYFLRIPDYDGLRYWIGTVQSGRTLAAVSDEFAASAEFRQMYGALTNAQFVDLVYRNVLGREADATGRDYWVGQLDAGALTRGGLMVAFSESAEFRAFTFREVYVTALYATMLRRAPDADGLAYWMNFVDPADPGEALPAAFLGAPEYRLRFLPR